MSATIAAARACARTLLLECLRINAFQGAIPHVMLVVDRVPCVQQKVLVEGYRQTIEELNGTLAAHAEECASNGHLYIPLDPTATAPTGSNGLFEEASAAPSKMSYSIAAFKPETFMGDMQRLQAFLRLCGAAEEATPSAASLSPADFEQRFRAVSEYLLPLPEACGAAGHSAETRSAEALRSYAEVLRNGRKRELLGFILIQRNAFQNELKQYRLRLALFNMGMRVAEHCHLESMSVPADALAATGQLQAAVADDQVCTYARSCAFPPHVAVCFAKAIADSIDLQAWRHAKDDANKATDSSLPLPPPPAYERCKMNEEVWELFPRGALSWDGEAAATVKASSQEGFDAALQRPIVGVGAPLRILSKGNGDGSSPHVLTFAGGLEDCLMNSGFYVAAERKERNEVGSHRRRFPTTVPEDEEAASAKVEDDATAGNASLQHPHQHAAAIHGRLKKKEYLALLKSQGEKPNKPPRTKAPVVNGDSDADEQQENTRARGPGTQRQQHCETMEDACDAGSAKGEEEGKAISVSIGGTFPIGEVISESFDLSKLSGTCTVFAYPGLSKEVSMSEPRPFTMTIEEGCVTKVSDDCPAEFADLLSLVRQAEGGRCYVRELGIGLNPFLGRQHVLADVTSFERQWGVHLSLGQRHPLFVKQKARRNADGSVCESVSIDGPVLKRKAGKYHIDVFVDASRLEIGDFAMDFTRGVAVQ